MSMDISLPSRGVNIQGMQGSQSSEAVGDASSTGGAEKVSDILGKDNVTIMEKVGGEEDAANANPASKLPELEEPNTKYQSIYEAIDKLVARLQLETDEKQMESAQNRIAAATPLLEAERNQRAEKLVILLSLMDSLGDRFFVTDSAREEGAAIAAFSAALMSMAPDDKKNAVFTLMSAISNGARSSHWTFIGMPVHSDNISLGDTLEAMNLGLDEFSMYSLQRYISEGSFDMAAKVCSGTPLADILGEAETLKEVAKNIADKFDFFGHFDCAKFMKESHMRESAKDIEAFAVKIAAQAEEEDSIDQLVAAISSNTSKTAEILSGMEVTDTEISGQITQMA